MKTNYMNTKDEVTLIENVSDKVSDKYVPIYTSELIDALEPEFTFVQGVQPTSKRSLHFVDLSNGTDTIRIYNSYDRTFALRMAYIGTDTPVDLGVDRLVHIGTKARNFRDDLETTKQDILEAVKTAKKMDKYLGTTKITKKYAQGISDIIFKKITKKKGFQNYTNYIDLLIPKVSIKAYITQSVSKFNNGDYTYSVNGIKRNGLKKSSVFRKIKLEKEIMDFIVDEFVELTL